MKSVNRIIKFLWVLSLLFFVGVLLYGYYLLPDVVCVQFDAAGNPIDYVERKKAFYGFSGVFALFNVLLLTLEKFTLLLPNRLKPVPNKSYWLGNEETKQGLQYVLSDWFYGFSAFLNCWILVFFFLFGKINIDMHSSLLQYAWVMPTFITMLLLWILYLPIRLSISKIFIR
ncbi:MAG TPA: hypothetical protein DCR46_08790 [Cytophagales bacterium]|nr:hypothetical protein [Cytophagales bacterium]